MRDLFIIPIQSISDIITNSSSELFICNTNKTCKEIDEMLVQMFGVESKGLQPAFLFNLEDFKQSKKLNIEYQQFNYDDVVSQKKFLEEHPEYNYKLWEYGGAYYVVDGWFIDKEDLDQWDSWRLSELDYAFMGYAFKSLFKAYKNWIKTNPKDYETATNQYGICYYNETTYKSDIRFLRYAETIDYLKPELDELDKNFDYAQDLDGKILLITTNDNSFNYDLFDSVRNTFNAISKHLG